MIFSKKLKINEVDRLETRGKALPDTIDTFIAHLSDDALDELHDRVATEIDVRDSAFLARQWAAFNIGDSVQFQHRNRDCVGTVVKKHPKNFTVRANSKLWRIDPRMLSIPNS
mgnify:CR=1 FL=1|tara:strand:+ start:225 stop:563 length:339 start_codon:yes stop_codon:yes gene_type:complete